MVTALIISTSIWRSLYIWDKENVFNVHFPKIKYQEEWNWSIRIDDQQITISYYVYTNQLHVKLMSILIKYMSIVSIRRIFQSLTYFFNEIKQEWNHTSHIVEVELVFVSHHLNGVGVVVNTLKTCRHLSQHTQETMINSDSTKTFQKH